MSRVTCGSPVCHVGTSRTFAAVATVTQQPAQRRAPKTGRTSNSVVKKAVMAVSGIIMILYLIAHMIGNLHAFKGADEFN